MENTRPNIIAADWLIAMDAPAVRACRKSSLRLDATGRIEAVGPLSEIRRPGDRVRFLPDCVLTPGLVNAHAHLDLAPESLIRGLAEHENSSPAPALHEWVVAVMAQRKATTPDEAAATARAGAEQSLACGVTAVVDVTPAELWHPLRAALAGVLFRRVALLEVLGFGQRGRQFWADAERLMEAPSDLCHSPDEALGISPHAPYSTCRAIYERSVALARARGWPIMTHLSETGEEIEFCRSGTGPWRELLESRHGPFTPSPAGGGPMGGQFDVVIPGCSPVAYAKQLGLLDYELTLLAHVNYLEPGDIELLADGRATVVYCPRSAAYFGHRGHPWRSLLAAGVNVAVGTDSLASCADLSIMNELRFLHERHPEVPATNLFALATRNGGAALPFGSRLNGRIAVGGMADLVAWPTGSSADDANTILRFVIESGACPLAVFVSGADAHERSA